MLIHHSPRFSIYFGDAQDRLMPVYYLNLPGNTPLLELAPFQGLKRALFINQGMFLHQTHSDQGLVVNEKSLAEIRPFKREGDFLITALTGVGIGVMTADCLPMGLYDWRLGVAGIVHAGWRGSVLGVAVKALERMQEEYGTKPEEVEVFFGPSALVCCYEVSQDFEKNLEGFKDKAQVLVKRNSKLYFDVPLFNRLQLEAAGINKESISNKYNLCTICDTSFFSYRRDREDAGRQMTVICLIR